MNRTKLLLVVTMCITFLPGCKARKEQGNLYANNNELTQVPENQLDVTGWVARVDDGRNIAFDLQIKGRNILYSIVGTPHLEKGTLTDRLDYSWVKVTRTIKKTTGGEDTTRIDNNGTVQISTKARTADAMLAGVRVLGEYTAGLVDSGLWFEGLKIDGVDSSGCLDYTGRNGHWTADGNCKFGACKVGQGGTCIFDSDTNMFSNNKLHVDATFGNMALAGLFEMEPNSSFLPNFEGKKTVSGYRAMANLKITPGNNQPPFVFDSNHLKSTDETSLRTLIAFLELSLTDIMRLK